MPEVIPSTLAPYLQDCFSDTSLTLVTSTLSTPANWLLIRILHTALSGSKSIEEGQTHPLSYGPSCKIIFVSLLRPLSQWLENGKKIGIDLASLSKDGKLSCIDGLGANWDGPSAISTESTSLKSLRLNDISTAVHARLRAATTPAQLSKGSSVIIIDGLDFVLASQPDAGVVELQHFISSVRTSTNAVVLTCSADSPLLHKHHEGATPLERRHSAFAGFLAHQSLWVFQLRGLDTGAAKDVTGVLRISNGGAHDDDERQTGLEEGEWLYQLKADGSAKVWLRG